MSHELLSSAETKPAAEAVSGVLDSREPISLFEAALASGRTCRELGDFKTAAEQFAFALALARQLGDIGAEADTLNLQAGLWSATGDPQRALETLESALELVQAAKFSERQANIMNNMGTLHTVLGSYPQALEHLKSAHELLQTVAPQSRSLVSNLTNLGSLYQELGDPSEAKRFFTQAAEVAQAIAEPLVAAAALNNLAYTHADAGEWLLAKDYFQKALTISEEIGAKEYEIDNLDGLGQVYAALKDMDQARETHTLVLSKARELGYLEGECDALLNLGRSCLAQNQPVQALEFLRQGLGVAEQLERPVAVYEAHDLLAQAYEGVGDFAQALSHQRAYQTAEKAVYNEENERQARRLTTQFDLERARQETEAYRLRSEITQGAREDAEATVRERTRELEQAQLEIVTRLAVAAEYRDDNTGEHTRRVGRNAAAIAHTLGWPEDQVQLLFTAARLHDVGKIAISDLILHKPGKLEPEELELMKTHAMIGARILSGGHSPLLQLAEEIALAHHERWDGKGYPLGLSGDAISLPARIVAVADVLDALTHERPYKRPWPVEEALAEIGRQSGYHFDPRVVRACLSTFGPGCALSPTDDPAAWHSAAQLSAEASSPALPYQEGLTAASSVERLQKLLAKAVQDLESSRHEAQVASRQMHEMAFTDPLTGLYNRRAFAADLEAEVARALHQGDSLSVLNLDIDLLKQVNDAEGHERGDALLCSFARAAGVRLQRWGRLYRIGGDEFAAILTHTGTEHFGAVRAQLGQGVAEVRADGFPDASVSMGIVALPEEVATTGDLLRLSDQRMYDDKLGGRKAGKRSLQPYPARLLSIPSNVR